jgi:CheY-like chemotaxis protein
VAGASILGDGSVVAMLNLPQMLRRAPQRVMPNVGESRAVATDIDMGMPHILIVDDSLSVRKSLSQLVEDAGYEPLLAKDGLEAIEVVSQHRPKVMLVDMEMPRMNGIELTEHIRANENTKDIPIFMITSRTTEKHRELARNAGVNEYLTKPYPEAELVEMINKAVRGA